MILSAFRPGNPKQLLSPVDIVESKGKELPGPQSVGGQEEQHRIIATSNDCRAVNGSQNALDSVLADRRG